MNINYESSADFAQSMDRQDPLRSYRDQYYHPLQANGEPHIYLCGNSLGLQPKSTAVHIQQELADWQRLGVEGHFHAKNPWLPYHEFLTEAMARVVGAKSQEVVVMNTLSVNLHLMMISFYRPTQTRHKIIIESDAFPSDRYAAASQIKIHGYDPSESLILLEPRAGEICLRAEDITDRIAAEGESPGGLGGAFVHERHLTDPNILRLEGWWGHNKETRFLMRDDFDPIPTAEAWQLSNPPILAMGAVWASLKIFDEVGMPALRKKADHLTGYLEYLVNTLGKDKVNIITPSDKSQRGSQLSIQVNNADKALFRTITEAGVIADWREPDVIRVAPTALYNSYTDVYRFYEILKTALEAKQV